MSGMRYIAMSPLTVCGFVRNSAVLSSIRTHRNTPRDVSSEESLEYQSKTAAHFQLDCSQRENMVLYKDEDIIVLNKPAGLPVHVGPKVRHNLTQYLHYWQYNSTEPPLLAHRLDKETTGALILTRHKTSAQHMAKLFSQRAIIKKYLAITVNVPVKLKGCIKSSLSVRNIATPGKSHTMNRVVMKETSRTKADDIAITEYEVLSVPYPAPKRCCIIQLHPVTGKAVYMAASPQWCVGKQSGFKHQLRVHLGDGLNCPVLGDHKFGGRLFRKDPGLRRKIEAMKFEKGHIYLHAEQIEIPGYFGKDKAPLMVTAPLPKHYRNTIKSLGLKINRITNTISM